MKNIRVNRNKMSKARIEIAKGIKAFFKQYNSEVMALATPKEIAEAVDILPSEEVLWANGVSSYHMMDYEWENLREIIIRDYKEAVRYAATEYLTDDGEHIFTSRENSDIAFIVYNPKYENKPEYRGWDEYMAGLRCRQCEGSVLLEVKECNKRTIIPKKWLAIGKRLAG